MKNKNTLVQSLCALVRNCEPSLSPSRLIYRKEQLTQANQVEKKEDITTELLKDQTSDKKIAKVKDKYEDDSFLKSKNEEKKDTPWNHYEFSMRIGDEYSISSEENKTANNLYTILTDYFKETGSKSAPKTMTLITQLKQNGLEVNNFQKGDSISVHPERNVIIIKRVNKKGLEVYDLDKSKIITNTNPGTFRKQGGRINQEVTMGDVKFNAIIDVTQTPEKTEFEIRYKNLYIGSIATQDIGSPNKIDTADDLRDIVKSHFNLINKSKKTEWYQTIIDRIKKDQEK